MGYACSQCKYRNYTCHSCGRAGHITEACKSKPQKVNKVEETEPSQVSSHDSVDPFSTSLYNLGSGSNGIEVPVKLNGTPLFMELDTGAGVSFISSETYTRHFKDTPPVHPTLACTLTQDTQVKVSGQLEVHLTYQDQSADVPLKVVEGSGPSLFGRDWLSHVKLDWKKICSICLSDTGLPQDVKSRLHTVIQSYPEVLRPGLGTPKALQPNWK